MQWGSGSVTDSTISTAALARLLGCTDRTVQQLCARGIIPRAARGQYPLPEAVQRYVEHLRDVAAGRGGEEGVHDLTQERARLAKEQADGAALKNAALRGELVEAEAVRREWSDILRGVRSAMLAVPSRVRASLPHLTAHDVEVLDAELRRALEGAADGQD